MRRNFMKIRPIVIRRVGELKVLRGAGDKSRGKV